MKLSKKVGFLLFVSALGLCFFTLSCKKNSTSPQVEDLTRPVIWVNVSELSFATSKAGGNAEPQTLEVKNTGAMPLNYTISDDADWLLVEPTSGSSTGEIVKHTVSINKAGLAARDDAYTATIVVECSESYNNPQKVTVSLNLSKEPPPKIWVDTQELTFNAQVNGEDPASQTIRVKNNGQGTLKYEISCDKSWVHINPNIGQCSGNTKSHTIRISASGLAVGDHQATLTIRDSRASNSPKNITIALKISKEALPQIWVSSKNVTFSMDEGSANPLPKTIKIKNTGGGTLKYSIAKDAHWVSISPNSGQSSGNEKSHRLSVDSSGLASGKHYATLTVTDKNASNNPQRIHVTFRITTPAPVSTDNKISIYCSPASATKNTIVSIPVSIRGNLNEIKVFGLELHFDPNMFQFYSCGSSSLTSGWAAVDGNEIRSGVIKVGGFAGSGKAIPEGSEGKIAVIKLKVTGDSYNNGTESQLTINSYTDAIAGMKPNPAKTKFTLQK